jgi:hypothetical protein
VGSVLPSVCADGVLAAAALERVDRVARGARVVGAGAASAEAGGWKIAAEADVLSSASTGAVGVSLTTAENSGWGGPEGREAARRRGRVVAAGAAGWSVVLASVVLASVVLASVVLGWLVVGASGASAPVGA